MSKRKAPFSDNPNSDFCEFLIELANYERNVNRNLNKYNAYRKAAGVIATYPSRLQSGKEAMKLDGVGTKIGQKIDEFLQTGKLKKLDVIRSDETSQAINELNKIAGIGPAKARDLVDAGIKSVNDLRQRSEEELSSKFKITHHQIIGLKHFEDLEKKVPRQEIQEIEQLMKKVTHENNLSLKLTICGSYRRGKPESGDIDALVSHPDYISTSSSKTVTHLKKLVDALQACGLITDVMSLGAVKFMGVCKLGPKGTARRLDIRLFPFDQFYCAVLYFTGSDMFNKEMRAHALSAGFTLNEYCLRRVGTNGTPGEPLPVNSERDIFEYIGFPYKKPEERSI